MIHISKKQVYIYDTILIYGDTFIFKVAFDNKNKTDKTIYIKHSYSVKGVKKHQLFIFLVINMYPMSRTVNKKGMY